MFIKQKVYYEKKAFRCDSQFVENFISSACCLKLCSKKTSKDQPQNC
jgi:hypothetical protein